MPFALVYSPQNMKHPMLLLIMLVAVSCGGVKKNEWDDLDYSSVYRKAGQQEYDRDYTPAYNTCVDDDFMSCK